MLKNIVLAGFLLVGIFLVYRLGAVSQTNVLGTTTSREELSDGQVTWCIDPINNQKKCYDPIGYKAGESVIDTFRNLANREALQYQIQDNGAGQGQSILTINGLTKHTNEKSSIGWRLQVNSVVITTPANTISAHDHDRYEISYRIN